MKILHVIDSMALENGGPPQVCAHLMEQQSHKHEVSVATRSDTKTCQQILKIDGLTVHQVKNGGAGEKFFGTGSKKVFRDIFPQQDIVHIHNMWEPLLVSAATIAHESKVPWVVTPHGMLDPWSMQQNSLKKKIAMLAGRRKMVQRAKFIHVLNSEEQDGVEELGIGNRCEIVPNGVSLERIDPFLSTTTFEQSYPQFKGRPFVLFLSRLHYKKGLDVLGEVAKRFCHDFPEWLILVAGPDGGARKSFEHQIRSAGIEKQVHLLGAIYGDMKYSLLSASRFFCLPSRQEGFSVAILEAMSASKPVAITKHCHFDEVQHESCGFVDALDPEAITSSFSRLAQSEELCQEMGESSRILIEKKYTWTKIGELLLAQYQQ